ncbi:MAG: ABC transporter permease [Clostridiales bacterium]|nr:ABC transporter permease [Clostridiales bacterium]
MKKKRFQIKGLSSAASSLIAIVVGLLAGFIILLISNPEKAVQGLLIILKGGFNNGSKGIGQVLYYATPIIATGLSVGFAFKTGLFNIGAPGQLMIGGFVSVVIGVTCPQLGIFHWAIALIGGMLAGALWGLVPGLFKALLNVNEVISSIMMNYIGMYGINFMIKNMMNADGSYIVYDKLKNQSMNVATSAVIPKWGLDKLFYNMKGNYVDVSSVNGGIIIAIILAIAVYIILNKTTFGYELKACGLNKEASNYAGINGNRSVILSMVIAGALAGAAGGLMYLAPSSGLHIHVEEVLSPQGFNGIPVALLGMSNPIGIIFSGLFISYITVGGSYLQSLKYMKEIIDVIISIIIYFSAFSLFVRNMLARRKLKHATANANEEADDAPKLNTQTVQATQEKGADD